MKICEAHLEVKKSHQMSSLSQKVTQKSQKNPKFPTAFHTKNKKQK